MLNKKQFSRLHISGLHLLMSALLMVAFGFSTSQAQNTSWLKGDTTFIPLAHTLSSVGDSLKYKLGTISLSENAAGRLVTTAGDSVQIKAPAGFLFVKDSVVTITASSVGGLTIDTAGFYAAYGIIQTSAAAVKVKANSEDGSGKYYYSFLVKTASTGTADTLSISGLYVQSVDTTGVNYDSTSVGNIAFTQVGVATNALSLSRLVALPGTAQAITFVGGAHDPNTSQKAGLFVSNSAGGFATADSTKGIYIYFRDLKGNLTPYGVGAPSVVPVIHGQSTLGNGTLTNANTPSWLGDANHHVGVSFYGLTYTKAETIDLKFTFGASIINTVADVAAGLVFAPNVAANISVSLPVNNHDTITVDESTAYTLTVTDKFYNPVATGTTVSWAEKTSHGGTFTPTASANTVDNTGVLSVTFNPSKFFVGLDTVLFTSGTASQPHVTTITPGPIGGLVVDFSDSVNHASVTEVIAAGKTVYARGFLRDAYGNPISATSASQITFSTNTVRKGAALGTPSVLTSALTEAGYPNTNKTAVGVAVPYTVSTTVAATPDTVTVTTGGYSVPVTIANRSSVPAKFKLFETGGVDSSLVASNYINYTVFKDSVWDAYGNAVTNPGSVAIAPTKSSYTLFLSTNGHTKFARAADTTAADTLLPVNGVYTSNKIYSTKTSGIDTLKVWSANASVSASSTILVTPAIFAAISLTPSLDTTLVAGQSRTFTIEKLDAFGNHIDWGLAGANPRGNTGATLTPSAAQVTSDSTNLTVDTVSTGHNRLGHVVTDASNHKIYTISGKPGVASVGGTYNMTAKYVAYTAGADTQKVYASLNGFNDTSLVRSIPTGLLRSFLAKIAAADSVKNAGDSVAVSFTAKDSAGNQIYTYNLGGQSFVLNHISIRTSPIITKDTTYYFSYVNTKGKYVKSKGFSISDTVFSQGVATIYLHKFIVDSTNTVTVNASGVSATTAQGVRFIPLDVTAAGAYGHWLVTYSSTDSLLSVGSFDFTVTPRDQYYNLNPTQQVIVNIASNQTSGFSIGSNPKAFTGTTKFTGELSGAKGDLILTVFKSDNSAIFGASEARGIKIISGVDPVDNTVPKVYSLKQNYPNPFNPTTMISYELPKAGLVTLKIYDILGKEVASLVNANQKAGKYSVHFNASALASGVYLYRIQSNDFVAVKKLMLLK